MSLEVTSPYYVVGKQEARWHRNKAERHLGKGVRWGITTGALSYKPVRNTLAYSLGVAGVPDEAFKFGIATAGAATAAHTVASGYHLKRSHDIEKRLREKRRNGASQK